MYKELLKQRLELLMTDRIRNSILAKGVLEEVLRIVDEIPTDVVEVVRCKDCKHQRKMWHTDKRMKDGGYWLYRCYLNQDVFITHAVDGYDNDYCSYGERRTDNAVD